MGNNAANEILCDDEEDEETTGTNVNTFQDTIKEMGITLFEKYPKKTSNLSYENTNGLIIAESVNEYTYRNFGYEYNILNKLISEKQTRVVSVNAMGIEKLIEFVKSISATFEQTQLPTSLNNLLGRNRGM